MTEPELLQLLARGEDSRHQFKRDATNTASQHVRPPLSLVRHQRNMAL